MVVSYCTSNLHYRDRQKAFLREAFLQEQICKLNVRAAYRQKSANTQLRSNIVVETDAQTL